MQLLDHLRPHPGAPHLTGITPRAALPGGAFDIEGAHLLSADTAQPPQLSSASFGSTPASFEWLRTTRARVQVPSGAISSDLIIRRGADSSNPLHANIGVPMAEGLHNVTNPAVDMDGNIFAAISGPRGERMPVSIMRIARDLEITPFVRDLLNISGLAFGPAGSASTTLGRDLFASARAEGIIYRITPDGQISTFAEGMGIATGIAFDAQGNLYVGDRSGTIFKLSPSGEIFVFATLEPATAFYHLCFHPDGGLLVTAPTMSSRQPVLAVDRHGDVNVFHSGLGRPQGMAFDADDNLYVAATLNGERGLVRVSRSATGILREDLIVSGSDLIGLCFLDDGCCALATHTMLYHIDLGIEGRPLP